MITFLENEKVILEKRRHWFVIVVESASLFLGMLLPPVAIAVMSSSVEAINSFIADYLAFVIFGIAAWWQLLWMMFFITWTNYYLDVLIVTNKRVIDVEQLGLFSRDMVEVRLEKIQDVKIEVKGIIASLLRFGNVHVQTAGESREVVVRRIAEPHQVKEVITKQHDETLNRHRWR